MYNETIWSIYTSSLERIFKAETFVMCASDIATRATMTSQVNVVTSPSMRLIELTLTFLEMSVVTMKYKAI